ncbi:chitin synthase-domain-containing protein [Chytridium lagenaria]|nr:chitin synthase-domain-containing protein [Chytridium lagenaria]
MSSQYTPVASTDDDRGRQQQQPLQFNPYPPPPPPLQGNYYPAPSTPQAQPQVWSPPQGYAQQPQLYAPVPSSAYILPSKPIQRMPTRKMVQKEVELEDGNFVVEVPVSKKMMEGLPYQDGEEFTHLKYTACTSSPEDFPSQYAVRARRYGRRIRIAVVVTMYNEDDVLFAKSMTAIMKNIAYLCTGRVAGWNKDSWKEILVCIVTDGRAKCNPLTLNVLSLLGCYTDGLAKASVNGKNVTAHIFEYTNQIAVRRDLSVRRPADDAKDGLRLVPCQTIFLMKEKNAKKINSHRWFFKAICDSVDPEICVLVDVGTKPSKESFFHLFEVAGACGEIVAELGPKWSKLINPIVAIQNFEYKMSNILDKPLESVFGYISVLPGAFSAYRYAALQGPPLECYFKGENPDSPTLQESNMYLAEDRILCFELVVKENSNYLLRYVKSARAETDVPSTLEALIKQRRRWINGSFFASVYATWNFKRIFSSGHSGSRKAILMAEFIYNLIQILFGWFNLGNFFLTFYFVFNIASDQAQAACSGGVFDSSADPFNGGGPIVFEIVKALYVFAIVMIFIASLGNRPDGSRILYNGVAILFGLLMFLMIFMGIYTIKMDIVVSLMSTYGLYVFSSALHLEPWHIFTCMLQYLFMIPTFINVLTVYAFCNLHDVSWGTKGLDSEPLLAPVVVTKAKDGHSVATVEMPSADEKNVDQEWLALEKEMHKAHLALKDRKNDDGPANAQTEKEDTFKQLRTNTLLLWIFTNGLLVYIFTNPFIIQAIFPNTTAKAKINKQAVNPYLTFLFWAVALLSLFRFIFSAVYLIGWWFEGLEVAGKRNPFKSAAMNVKKAVNTDNPS